MGCEHYKERAEREILQAVILVILRYYIPQYCQYSQIDVCIVVMLLSNNSITINIKCLVCAP